MPVDDAITYIIQHYGVVPKYKQRLISILRGFALQYKKNAPYIPLSPAYIKDDKINIDFDTSKIPIEATLTQLHNFLVNLASNPEGFLATFSWSILAPFHYYVKTLSELTVYVPNLVLSGKTKGGKTSLTDVFILKGYDVLNKDDKGNFQYHLQDVATTFTLMNTLKYSNLPAIFDEIGMQFFNYHKESIKGYGSSPRFGQRGTASQNTNKYWGIRSFVATMNDSFDPSSDLALSRRLIIIPFDERNTERQNRDAFIKFYNSLPDGFMFAILKHLFQGKPIKELVSELEICDTPDKWVSMGIKFINKLCRQLGIPEFPEYEAIKTKTETMAYEIASSLASEYDRGFNNQYHNSPIWGEVSVENKKIGDEPRRFIYFTGGAFRVIMRNYNNHFKTATEYLNNIPKNDDVRVENEGKRISKRIENDFKQCYIVSIPEWNEDGFDSDKGNENDPTNGGNETQNSSGVNSDNESKKSSTDNVSHDAAKDDFKEENSAETEDIEKRKAEDGNNISKEEATKAIYDLIKNKHCDKECVKEMLTKKYENHAAALTVNSFYNLIDELKKEGKIIENENKYIKLEQSNVNKAKNSNEDKKPGEIFFYKSEHDCIFDCVNSFDFGRYHYFKFDSSKIDMNSRDWNTWATHSMPVKEPEFERFEKYSIKYGGEKK